MKPLLFDRYAKEMLVSYMILTYGLEELCLLNFEDVCEIAGHEVEVRIQSKQNLVLTKEGPLLQLAKVVVVMIKHFYFAFADKKQLFEL